MATAVANGCGLGIRGTRRSVCRTPERTRSVAKEETEKNETPLSRRPIFTQNSEMKAKQGAIQGYAGMHV